MVNEENEKQQTQKYSITIILMCAVFGRNTTLSNSCIGLNDMI